MLHMTQRNGIGNWLVQGVPPPPSAIIKGGITKVTHFDKIACCLRFLLDLLDENFKAEPLLEPLS